MMRIALVALVTLAMSGCLSAEGGITDFMDAPDCPDSRIVEEAVAIRTMAGTGRVAGGASQTFRIDVADATDWNAKQASCVDAIFVALEWENTPTAGGDYYVSVDVPGTGMRVVGHDDQQSAVDGAHRETVLAPTGLKGFTGQSLLDGLSVTVHTDWGNASESGVPATLSVGFWT